MVDVDRFRSGDHAYFREILETHGPGVRKVCGAYALNEADIDDLVQGTFMLAYANREAYRGDGPFPAWLFRMARNHCLSRIRSATANRRRLQDLEVQGLAGDFHGKVRGPDAELEEKESQQRLFGAVDQLSEKERETVVLRLIEDRPAREVASAMNITQASVRSNLSRAVRSLRGIIKGDQS